MTEPPASVPASPDDPAPPAALAPGLQPAKPSAATAEAAQAMPGLVFCRHLGQGRSSHETLVRDQVTQRHWVLKEYLPPSLAQRRRGDEVVLRTPAAKATFEEGRAAFVAEALWLAGVRHPALRRVHRVWQTQGTAFALLAPVEGATLLRHLARLPRESQVPVEEWLVTFLRDIAGALQVMHRAGRLHGGLHPGEVVVTPTGHSMLLGLSTMQLRRTDGTPLFADGLRDGCAAPEQYGLAPPQPEGPWTDLYALAAIAYGLMTGLALEPAPQRAAATGAERAEGPAGLSRLPAGRFHDQLVQGIERTLNVAPSRRPQSVSEFLAATGLTLRRAQANAQPLQFLFDVPRTMHPEVVHEDVRPDLDLDIDALAPVPALTRAREVAASPDVAASTRAPNANAGSMPGTPAGWLDPTLLDA